MSKNDYPIDYQSCKIPNSTAKCRSPMEANAFEDLDYDPNVISYHPEPYKISYEYNGKSFKYVPDILIEYKNGSRELVEIKPIYDVGRARNIAKFKAAKDFAALHGYKFRIWVMRGVGYHSSYINPIQNKYDNGEDALRDWDALLARRKLQEKRKMVKTMILNNHSAMNIDNVKYFSHN
jgi:hypothetical protein